MHITRVKILNVPYFLFRSIEKFYYLVQKRDYDHQMKIIFHHSLINIIVLHHLNQLNISWSNFTENDIFTTLLVQNAQVFPPPSHPSTSIPPYHPIVPTSSSTQTNQPISPPPSPFHVHIGSPSRVEIRKPKRSDLRILEKTYQRGHRKVFVPHVVGGTLPSSLKKQVDKGKQKVKEEDIQ